MIDDVVAVNYAATGLRERVAAVVERLGGGGTPLTPETLAPYDHFHTGGLQATVAAADLLGPLAPQQRLLDAGSGLGGPARYFAARFGCEVDGVDLSESFVEAAEYLNAHTSLADRVRFQTGSVLDLPFAGATFDAVVMQHVAMNVRDRAALYDELGRVLRPRGILLTHDVVRLSGEPDFPVPWAGEARQSWLLDPDAMRDALMHAGFRVDAWRVDGAEAARAFGNAAAPEPPPFAVMLGVPDMRLRIAHLRDALLDGRVGILTAKLVR